MPVVLLYGQTAYTITGTITDARTGEGVPFANVALVGRPTGTSTDEKGKFSITTKILTDSLAVSSMGYQGKRYVIDRKKLTQQINIQLVSSGLALQTVVVHAGENPAFRIIRGVRNNRDKNDRSRISAYEYDSYSKTEIAISHLSDKARKNPFVRRITDAMNRFDTITDEKGNRLLPVMMTESVSRFYYRDSPQTKREDIIKTRLHGLSIGDDEFLSQLVGGNFLAHNFYKSYLTILNKDFASPIGENWRGSYEFYLADTTQVGDRICYEIHFDPKRQQDLVFTGKMWIDTTTYALCQIDAHVGPEAALNFVRDLTIEQELEPVTDSTGAPSGWLPTSVRFIAELTGIGKKSLSLRAKITTHSSNYVVNKPHPVPFYAKTISVSDSVKEESDAYWNKVHRTLAGTDSLSREDQKSRQLIDSLRAVPIVRTIERVGEVLVLGWYKIGKIELGPYPYIFAVNNIEGLRLRMGIRTNESFSPKWVLRAYVAYGTLDHRIKGSLEADYMFSRSHWSIGGLRFTSDLERLGLNPEIMPGNRLFYAVNRFGRFRGGYRSDMAEAFFRTDLAKGVQMTFSVGSRNFSPIFPFQYRVHPEEGANSPLQSDIFDTFLAVEARLSRKETFLVNGNERLTLGTRRAPVLTLRYTRGTRLLGGQYDYNRYTLKAQQSFRIGTLGRSSYTLLGGYVPNPLPTPLLFPHTGNPTFFLVPNTFNRMNFYEFVSDRFLALHYQHRFDGFLFNRLPGIQKLNWRLVANADILWGDRTRYNRSIEPPQRLPDGRDPTLFGQLEPDEPYMEAGIGIENIFKVFRIQLVERLNYLAPGIDQYVIKGGMQLSF